MVLNPRRFDDYLPSVSSNDLKPMVKLWGSKAQPRKDECIAIIRRGLNDPARVREAIASLAPYERTALAILKWMGDTVEAAALATALRASGVKLPPDRGWTRHDVSLLVEPLFKRGLLLFDTWRGAIFFGGFNDDRLVFSDDRLLAHIGPPEFVPLPIEPSEPSDRLTARRPPAVMMDILSILQGISSLGGLQLTKAGALRAADVRKLLRAMNWREDQIEVDGLTLHDPVGAFVVALEESGFLADSGAALNVNGSIAQISSRPYVDQIADLLRGFVRAGEWSELPALAWRGYGGAYRTQGRLALLVALASLPAADRHFSIGALESALYSRIGEHFSLYSAPAMPYLFNKTADEMRREEAAWRARVRANWRERELPWIVAALTSWLYFLGIVELSLENSQLTHLRLTELGRALLGGEGVAPATETPNDGPTWLVQPDFELLVYLDRARPEQIAFAERHAERLQAQAYVARYRLTRDSVYQGLESGASLDELLDQLRDGAGGDLPQNVVASIREWARQREQITLRRNARLLEFPDQDARQRALAGGIAGMPFGDRFVLLTGAGRPLPPHRPLDYHQPLPPCLTAREDGLLTLARPAPDLLLEAQVGQWAEPRQERTWQLTAASVAAGIKAGGTLTQLQALLGERLTRPLPPLLGVAVRAWAGKRPAIGLAEITVLRCADPAVFGALLKSPTLKPFLRGALAPDLLLVDSAGVAALREQLVWAGVTLLETIEVQ